MDVYLPPAKTAPASTTPQKRAAFLPWLCQKFRQVAAVFPILVSWGIFHLRLDHLLSPPATGPYLFALLGLCAEFFPFSWPAPALKTRLAHFFLYDLDALPGGRVC